MAVTLVNYGRSYRQRLFYFIRFFLFTDCAVHCGIVQVDLVSRICVMCTREANHEWETRCQETIMGANIDDRVSCLHWLCCIHKIIWVRRCKSTKETKQIVVRTKKSIRSLWPLSWWVSPNSIINAGCIAGLVWMLPLDRLSFDTRFSNISITGTG